MFIDQYSIHNAIDKVISYKMDAITEMLEVEMVCWAQAHPEASWKDYALESFTPQCKLRLELGGLTWHIVVPTGYQTDINPEDGQRKRLWDPFDRHDMVILQSKSTPFHVSIVDQSKNTLELLDGVGQEVANRACDEDQVHGMFKNLLLAESVSQSMSEGGTTLVTGKACFRALKGAETLAEVLDCIYGLAKLYNERKPTLRTACSEPDSLFEDEDVSRHMFDINLTTIKEEVIYAQGACADAVARSVSHPEALTLASLQIQDGRGASSNKLQQVGWSSKELQWCEIAFDPTSLEVECTLRLNEFMENSTIATALGFRIELPLQVRVVPDKVQMDSQEWNGDVDVYVSQLQSGWHNHISEEICGFQFLLPRIVQHYLHNKVSTYLPKNSKSGTTGLKGGLFVGLLQTLVRRLTNLNADGSCCVCGLLTNRPTSIHLEGKSLWPCGDNLCQATYTKWQELSSVDSPREREEEVQTRLMEENLRDNFSDSNQQALKSALLDVESLSEGQRSSAMAKTELWNQKDPDAFASSLSQKRDKPESIHPEGCSDCEQEPHEADKLRRPLSTLRRLLGL